MQVCIECVFFFSLLFYSFFCQMMKLFKKKKSDKNIANTIVQQDTREFESPNVKKQQPNKPATSTIPVAAQMDTAAAAAARSSSPPAILMPKPRRLLTPTRAILGRFDHDKTQVEDEEGPTNEQLAVVQQQEISPILLPTPREEPLLPQLVKPVARHLTQQQQYKPQQQPNAIGASSLSTVMSDDSSRVYESAMESLSDTTEDDHVAELPDLPMLKKQPSHKPIVNPHHVPLPQQQQLPTQAPLQPQLQPPQQQQQQQLQQDIMASGVISDASSRTVSPPYYTRKRANTGPSSGSSAITVTPLQAHNKQTLTPNYEPLQQQQQQPMPPPPQPAQTLLSDHHQQQQQQQKDDQEFLLRELKKQVELIEKQRIKDREEWNRKEQELLTHRHQMMETLIETKDQLTHVLKNREEENNKAKLTYYDKQLKQQQLHQMQKQVIEMGLSQQQQQQQQQQEEDIVDEPPLPATRINGLYYQQQSYYYENDPAEAPLDELHLEDDEAPMYHQRRIRNRSKSDEHMKHNTRSSSRSSYHYQQQHALVDDGGRRSSNSRNNYHEDMPLVCSRKPVSRRASNASNKSSGGHRFDHASPATTLVSNHTVSKSTGRRPRARSIESARWYEEQQQQQQQQHMMIKMNTVYLDDMMVPYEKLRKSRSAGRDLHSMRPVSRASSVYNLYYDEGDLMDDEVFDSQPSFYDSGYYSNYNMENIPPPNKQQQQQQQMMSRYSSDIPYYPPQQQPQQYVYSPVDCYYQQPPRHNPRYNARHHYSSYN
ncbi:hypothetical protein V8B55DRAFT_1467875 [Mucor lusitanicus]